VTAAARQSALLELEAAVAAPRPPALNGPGGPIVGYLCAYVPPELLLAAGLRPLRLRGAGNADSASGDAYLSHLTCSFVRHVAALFVDGGYAFLAGAVAVNTCDHVRRLDDVVVAKARPAFHGFVAVPRAFRADVVPFYVEELRRLATALEQHFGVTLTAAGLREAVGRVAAVRQALARLDELRRADPPRLRGSDLLLAGVAARVLPPEEFLVLAGALRAAAAGAPAVEGIRARVVLAGGELDDPRFVRVLESQGAHVAGDLLCWGQRGLGGRIDLAAGGTAAGDLAAGGTAAGDLAAGGTAAGDLAAGGTAAGDLAADGTGAVDELLAALARAYLHQLPCARMMGEFPRRYAALRELARQTGARGVIFQRIKFCQIWSTEVHNLRLRFAEDPLPLLVLDREYGAAGTGQIKTRVQAFMERLRA
jgi:benzoyl-CoA reductase subunit C